MDDGQSVLSQGVQIKFYYVMFDYDFDVTETRFK